MKVQELFEMAKAREFSSGFMKAKAATKLARDFRAGRGTFELSDGRVFKPAGKVGPLELKAGMIVLAAYNDYNQGAQLYEIQGVTSGKEHHGVNDETPHYASVREMLEDLDAGDLNDVENEGWAPRLVVKDLEDGDSGAWFYIHEGEWVRGSGAEKLLFTLAREV